MDGARLTATERAGRLDEPEPPTERTVAGSVRAGGRPRWRAAAQQVAGGLDRLSAREQIVVPLGAAVIVLLLALAVPPLHLSADDTLYLAISTAVATGHGLVMPDGGPILFRPPLFALILAPGVAAAGLTGATITNLLAGAAAAALLAVIARRVAGTGAAVLAIALGFAELGVLRLVHSLRIDVWATMLVLLAAVLLIRTIERGDRRAAVGFGLALAAAGLVKLTVLAFLPVPLISAWWAGSGRRSDRLASVGLGYATFGAVCLVAWAWPLVTAGGTYLIPATIAWPLLALGALLVAAVVLLSAGLARAPRDGLVDRMIERAEGGLALAVTIVASIGWGICFLLGLVATEGIPDPNLTLQAALRYGSNEHVRFLWPAGLALCAWLYALWRLRRRRPADLIAATGLFSFAPVPVFVALNFYDSRSSIPFLLFSAVWEAALVATVVTAVARRARAFRPPRERSPRIARLGAALLVVALVGGQATHLAREASTPTPIVPAGFDWRIPTVASAATWLEANVAPGSTVMVSWLYGAELYRQTDARFRMPYLPTVTARITESGPVLTPSGTGRRFRDATFDAAAVGLDWLFMRKHPRGPYVGLTQQALLAAIRADRPSILVLTGEHEVQSTATIAPYFETTRGFSEVARFTEPSRGATILIYRVEPDEIEGDPATPIWVNGPTFRALLRDVPRARLGWDDAEVVSALGRLQLRIEPSDPLAQDRLDRAIGLRRLRSIDEPGLRLP